MNTNESVGHNFARLLSPLKDPRLSIFLCLLTRSYLTREAIEKELKFSPDIMKRALTWLQTTSVRDTCH